MRDEQEGDEKERERERGENILCSLRCLCKFDRHNLFSDLNFSTRCSCVRNRDLISSNWNQPILLLIKVTRNSNSFGNPSRITSSCSCVETNSPMDISESEIVLICVRNSVIDRKPLFVLRSFVRNCRAFALVLDWKF